MRRHAQKFVGFISASLASAISLAVFAFLLSSATDRGVAGFLGGILIFWLFVLLYAGLWAYLIIELLDVHRVSSAISYSLAAAGVALFALLFTGAWIDLFVRPLSASAPDVAKTFSLFAFAGMIGGLTYWAIARRFAKVQESAKEDENFGH